MIVTLYQLKKYNSPENRNARLRQYAANDKIANDRRQARQLKAMQNISRLEDLYKNSDKIIAKDTLRYQESYNSQTEFANAKNKFSSWFKKKQRPAELDQNKDRIKIKNVIVMLFMYFNTLNLGYNIKHSAESNVSGYSRNTILEYTQSQGLAAIVRTIGYVDKFGGKN